MPVCIFVRGFAVLVVTVGGRIDTDVAGRASTRGAEAGALRNVEAMRPATVAGLGGG